MRFDFDTWLMQTYGLKSDGLTKKELELAQREYKEEYPPPGSHSMKMKTYPFKRYLDSEK